MTEQDRARGAFEHALAYMQAGWKLVMMAEGTKGPTHAGWNTPAELVDTPERAVARLGAGPQNMGLVHEHSGTVAIDIDDEVHTRLVWSEFGLDYERIMAAGCRIWSKTNRDKVIFRAPPLPLLKVQWPALGGTKATDRLNIFELRAGPNQDVLPPSRHPDGHLYTWWPGRAPWELDAVPEIPNELLQFWRALHDRSTGVHEAIQELCPWKPAPVGKKFVQRARTLSTEHGDVVGQYNRVTEVGELLERHGYKKRGRRYLAPSSSTVIPGVVVLDGKCFSHHGSDPLADGYAHDAFDLLVTLEHGGDFSAAVKDAAAQLGIDRRPALAVDFTISEAEVDAMIASSRARQAGGAALAAPASPEHLLDHETGDDDSHAPPPAVPLGPWLPAKLLRPPGVFGETVDWMLKTAQYPQPELAVAATLSLFATVLGQKVRNWSDLRTNLYVAGVAGTAAGKEHGRKCIKKLLLAGGCQKLVGGDKIASGAGLMQRLTTSPVSLFMQDEFGMKLAGWTGKKAPAHLKEVVEVLLSAFGQASEVMPGTERADAKLHPRQDIPYPCLGLYGTTTENIWSALSGDDVASGLLNRILVVTAGEKPAYQRAAIGEPPQGVVDFIQAAQALRVGNGLTGLTAADPIVMPDSGMADTLYTQFMAEVNQRIVSLERTPGRELLAPLWGRAFEHANKIGLVMACTRYRSGTELQEAAAGNGLEVDAQSAGWAIEFVRAVLVHMEAEVATRVGDSDFDRLCQEALRVIESGGVKGRTEAELCRHSRSFRALEPRVQDQVMEALRRRAAVLTVRFEGLSNRRRVATVSTNWMEKLASAGGEVVQIGDKVDTT